ncbi:hypothetical protein DFJ58DRAFT_730796 [Suillus subalutaceus]|uniref:uncharacterized protein n=1 Tax=Suillus subalutaceus TaxID=48586 RepID=UPI001B867BDC|nr:uncharacterized protein DFJ58DRAFT_730796 [Suillus subalutaceus]KAG1845734.1 hypothetical protein DFJ58DRAFT_730796 [Suillus subalutaceus]
MPLLSMPPSSPHSSEGSLHASTNDTPEVPDKCTNIQDIGRKQEMQMYVMALDRIETDDDEQDNLFTMYSIDSVYSSYLAARNRVHQYTKLLMLLKRKEDAWAQRAVKASYLMPEYKPAGWIA